MPAEVAEPPVQVPAPPAPKAPPISVTVTPETITKGKAIDPPKSGTARSRLHQSFLDAAPKAEEPKAKAVEAKPESKPEAKVESKTEAKVEKAPEVAKEEPAGKEKVSPWKLVDQYKAKAAELEKQLADTKTSALSEPERKAIAERIDKAEARAKELEDEIRYVSYEKSAEFKTKYQEPYEKAWSAATAELSEITVTDPAGNVRVATADDLLTLVNLPLGKAREVADATFGNFADDVMAHRKEIRNLFQSRQAALDEARKTGAEREKKMAEEHAKSTSARQSSVKQAWEKANQDALVDPKYGKFFTPVEGDQEGNQRLAKGYQMVDRAFTEDPLDPKWSADERASVVKRQAAVRNRAAGFGRLALRNEQLEAKIAELTKELESFKSSEPDTTGSQAPTGTQPVYTKAIDRLHGAIHKLAK